jgi:hypothetical protein
MQSTVWQMSYPKLKRLHQIAAPSNFDGFVKNQKPGFRSWFDHRFSSFRRSLSPKVVIREPESRNYERFWTPAPVPDHDPGFAGVKALTTFFTKASVFCRLDFILGIVRRVLEVADGLADPAS